MTTIRNALWLLVLLAAFLNGCDSRRTAATDNLDGTWVVESWIVDGKPMPEEIRDAATLVIDGESSEFRSPTRAVDGKFVTDSTKRPKTVDVTIIAGPGRGKTLLGIYDLKHDVLRNSSLSSETVRPTEFSSTAGSGQTLIVYKRSGH